MKTLHSYRPIIRYCHGTESAYTCGSMTRFYSRAVDASSFMQITMRHLPLLHLDICDFPIVYHPPAIFIMLSPNWNFLHFFVFYDEISFSWNSFANIIFSLALFPSELYTLCNFLIVGSSY